MTPLDLQLFAWLNADLHTPHWRIVSAAFVSTWLPAMLMLLLACVAAWQPVWRRSLCLALLSLLMAWIAVRVFRAWLPMPRPAMLGLGVQWLSQGERPGFPSLHAAGAFAVAVSVLCAGRAAWAAVYVGGAAAIALSRVYLGLHFPSDVIVGALLGSLLALAVERSAERLQNPALQMRDRRHLQLRDKKN